MISYLTYKFIHVVSIFVFLCCASIAYAMPERRKLFAILIGVSSFFVLVGGMGLMARLGNGFQPWIIAKLVIWLVLTGGAHMIAKRVPSPAKYGIPFLIGGGALAAWLALFKPF